jgi:hypothetical protein
MTDELNTDGAFDALLGLKNSDDPSDGEKKSSEGESQTVTLEEYEKLKKDFDEFKKSSEGTSQKLEQISQSNEVINRIREAFVPKDPKAQNAKEQKKLLDEFDADPIEFLERFVDEKLGPVADRQHRSDLDRYAKEVMTEIDKEYSDIDWAKNGKKIAAELQKFSPEFKQNNPKEATVRAMQALGIGKKRDVPADFPYLESSNTYSAERQKARESEAEKYKKGIFNAAKQATASPLKGFFSQGS